MKHRGDVRRHDGFARVVGKTLALRRRVRFTDVDPIPKVRHGKGQVILRALPSDVVVAVIARLPRAPVISIRKRLVPPVGGGAHARGDGRGGGAGM